MEMAVLIIGIILCLAGVLAIGFGLKRATTTTTTVVNVVKHEYKTSKDYGRLYDLLVEGREIIIINKNGYPSRGHTMDLQLPEGTIKKFFGFNLDNCLDGCTRDKFILYCQFHDITYLDQIDKYLLMEDYMKK